MSIVSWLEEKWAELKSSTAVSTAVADVENIGGAGWAYIKTNGLTDLYQIALTLVAAAVPGASWTAVLSGIKAKAVTDGVAILDGAEAVVAAQAQADLMSAGKLAAPVATAPAVASTTPPAA